MILKSTNGTPNRILVTGGTGFLGQRLVSRLLAEGHPVRILARPYHQSPTRRTQVLQTLLNQGAEIVWGDLADIHAVRAAVEGCQHVFHLAGRLFIWGSPKQDYIDLHIEGTRTLLNACSEASQIHTFVHCSSTGVLGPTGPLPLDENAPLNPSNIYEATKAEGERLVLQTGKKCGLPVVVARPGLVYGPGDLHLLSWFRSINQGFYRVVGRGDNLLHPTYVDDVVVGLLLCSSQPQAFGRIYHLVGEKPVTIEDLANAIAKTLSKEINFLHLPFPLAYGLAALIEAVPGLSPEARPLTRSRVRFMVESRVYSGERARQELGFFPQVDLISGLAETVNWYKFEGLL